MKKQNPGEKPTKAQKQQAKEQRRKEKAEKRLQNAKKRRQLTALALVAVIVLTGTGLGILFHYQPKSSTTDYTMTATVPGGTGKNPLPDQSVQLSESLVCFAGDDAKEVNRSIKSASATLDSLTLSFDSSAPESVKNLGVGDVFVLEGDENDPLAATYFGKVTHISHQDSALELVTVTPSVDEVFDAINLDIDEDLTRENLISFDGVEGATLEGNIETLSVSDKPAQIENLTCDPNEDPAVLPMKHTEETGEISIKLDVDFLEAMKLKDKIKDAKSLKEGIKAYKEEHEKEKKKKKKYEDRNLNEKIEESAEAKLKFTGEAGVKDLAFNLTCDRIQNLDFNDFGYQLTGTAFANVGVSFDASFSFDELLGKNVPFKDKEKKTGLLSAVKCEGLSKKVFPLAFLQFHVGAVEPVIGPAAVNARLKAFPFILGIMFYSDLSGEISIAASLDFEYSKDLYLKHQIVKDGKIVNEIDKGSEDADCSLHFTVGINADIDFKLFGISAQCYICNLNLLEIVIAEVGAEAQGTLTYEFEWEFGEKPEQTATAEGYLRGYLHILGIRVKFRCKVDLYVFSLDVPSIDLEKYLFDLTLFTVGKRYSTHFNKNTMSVGILTAADGDLVYYKDMNGNLAYRNSEDYSNILFRSDSGNEFVRFCGIDETYVYVLFATESENGVYDIYRIAREPGKNGNAQSRKLADGIRRSLMQDDAYLYYTDGVSGNTVYRLDREKGKSEEFHTFSDEVIHLSDGGDKFRAVTASNNFLSMFFGGGSRYYKLDKDGKNEEDLGTSPNSAALPYATYKNYIEFRRIISAGHLRDTASNIYRADDTDGNGILTVETQYAGWNPTDAGIFTAHSNNRENSSLPYRIDLCDGYTGAVRTVLEVENAYSVFTLSQDSRKNWYYMDQNDASLLLYECSSDFSSKQLVAELPRANYPMNLEDCSAELQGETLYFYTYPNETESHLIYRYTLS